MGGVGGRRGERVGGVGGRRGERGGAGSGGRRGGRYRRKERVGGKEGFDLI